MEEEPKSVRDGGRGPGQGPVAADMMDEKPRDHHIIPVWFFVGIILLVYGLIILVTGILEFSQPPSTVLGTLHPAVWWGALLTVIGGIYVYLYMPRRQ